MRHERFIALMRSFPVLANYAPTVSGPEEDINLMLLDRWAAHDPTADEEIIAAGAAPYPGRAAQEAVRFVLNLFNSSTPWQCGQFSIGRALGAWDPHQLGAFQAFVADPFVP